MIGMLLKQMKYWNVLEKKVMEWRWERLWLSSCCGNHWREWGAWQSCQSWSQQHILCLSSASLSFSHFHTFLHCLLGQLFKPLTPFRIGNLNKHQSQQHILGSIVSRTLSLSFSHFSRPLTPFITFEHYILTHWNQTL